MKVLLTGQGGFIGSRLRAALLRRGHEVPPLRVDFRIADTPDFWLPHLAAVDVVINAAGIFRERRPGDFDLVNERAPCALFRAAAKSDVGLIIQFSALGADEAASSRFHLSKRAADECLRSVPVPSYSLQPSLVFGEGGASARLLEMLASLPLIPLPGDGRQRIQPIHVDDLVDAVIVLVESTSIRIGRTIALVGPREISLRDFLAVLRESLGLPAARFIEVPMRLAHRLARVAAYLSSAPLDPEALEMLERDNVADARDTEALLGHPPRPPHRFVPPALAPALRTQAMMQWLLPVLRISIAVMWIWSAIVSVALYPLADSYRLLAAVGVPPALAPLALYGAAACDLVLGALTLLLRRRRLLWQMQIVLILVYTAIIAIRLPEYLVHPFGPIVKNLPILALLWMLVELEPKQRGPQTWNT